ncbi:MAG: ATP-binding protein [Acidimicrobiales bacterium]
MPPVGKPSALLVRLVPKMDSVVPGLPPPLQADPETERYRLFDAVASWLGSVSPDGETMLVIDDLHWSERSTILLLRHLVRSAEPMRLLIVATYRDTDVGPDHPLTDFLADLGTEARVQRIPLAGLDLHAVNEMVNGVGGNRPGDTIPELSQLLWSETVGNPLFVQEILRSLVERGILRERGGLLTTVEPITSIDIPESVREVVVRRLGRLRPRTRMVLSVAAVTGVAIDYDAVVAATGLDEEDVLDALDEATAAAIVRETPSGSSEFVHPLVRSTIYTNLGSARRHQRHRHIAEALLQRSGSDPVSVSYHLDRANVADPRIVEQLATAGNKALQRLAFDESVRHFGRALDALATVGPAWRGALAVSCISAGDHERAASIVDDLMTDREPAFPQDIAWLLGHSVLAEAVAAVGSPEQAEREYKTLLPYAGRIPNLAMVARPAVSLWLAILAARAGWTDAASGHFSDAVHEHERIGAHVFLALTRLEWGQFLLRQGETESGRALLAEAEEAAVRLGSTGIATAGAALLTQASA